jgi:hypothetical protein
MTDKDESPMTATEVIVRQIIQPLQAKLKEHDRLFDTMSVIMDREEPEPEHDKLFTALAKAQAEITSAELDAEGQAGTRVYKYATLTSVMEAIRGPLSKNGLSIIQLPERFKADDGAELLRLTTILAHSSGQSISNKFAMYPPKQDPQGIGSAMTYMRRYTIMAIVGIAGANDDDAEGTKAEPQTITPAEADAILSLADDLFGSDADALLARMCDKIFDVPSIPKIPKGEAEVAMDRIRNTRKRKDEEKKPKPKAKPAADAAPSA